MDSRVFYRVETTLQYNTYTRTCRDVNKILYSNIIFMKNKYIYLMLVNNKYIKYIVQYCVRKKYIVRRKISFVHFLDYL